MLAEFSNLLWFEPLYRPHYTRWAQAAQLYKQWAPKKKKNTIE